MDFIFFLLALILSLWTVRSICIKKQSALKKCGKSIFGVWYFLFFAGFAMQQPENRVSAVVMMAIGAVVVWYANWRAGNKVANRDNNVAPVEYATDELFQISFYYQNGSGESLLRDVDVKKFDGQYVEGYCHLSHAVTTFRLDRIEGDVVLRNSGWMMDASDWAKEMNEHRPL